jgi:glycosyltransferase involved in cell wall biosynthesis
MLDTLARHPQLKWVLVGGAGTLPPALTSANPEQLRLLAHRTDLPSLLRCCDLYVNPPRLGGGLSVGEAMAEGLPVLALAGGDAGSKLAGMAQDNEAAYFDELEALLASPERRAHMGAAMQHFGRELDLANSGPSLMQACLLAQQRFRERQAS